jgi:hypothetical protein
MGVQQYMKPLFTFFLMMLFLNGTAQSTGQPQVTGTTTNALNPLVVQKPAIQANKFYRQIMNNPADADSWLHYYTWLKNSKEFTETEKKQPLSQTILSSQKHIAASWQYALMNFIQSGKRNKSYLDAALESSTDKSIVYPYAIHYAIISKDETLLHEYARDMDKLRPLSPALYEYHFNCLQSAAPDAIIYAKGLGDLAPMAILQQVYGIRRDIRFAYYDEKISDTTNAYICLSAGKEIIRVYPDAGYTGLLIRISNNKTNEELIRHSAAFSFSQLKSIRQLNGEEKIIYKNYLPAFILIYRFYKNNNDVAADEWMELIQKTASLTGSINEVNKMLGQ